MSGNKDKGSQKNPLWGIFPKLPILFLGRSIIALMVLGYMANKNMARTGLEFTAIAMKMGADNLKTAREIGHLAIEWPGGSPISSMKGITTFGCRHLQARS